MQTQTQEVMSLVRKSEEETEKVRLEKMSIMQKWTTAVINLSKRDEALESFRNAMKKQELALKNVKAEIDGTKEEIINFQEKHEHLTTLRFDFFYKKGTDFTFALMSVNLNLFEFYSLFSLKAERLCMNRKNQIKRIKRQVEDAKLELNKVHESHLKTSETLKMTENQGNLSKGIDKKNLRREEIEPIKRVLQTK